MTVVGRELRFWTVVLAAGAIAGAIGIAVTELLHLVQHAAFGWSGPTFLDDVRHASPLRRVVAVASGGLVAGIGWLALRRHTRVCTVDDAVAGRPPHVVGSTLDGCLQIVVVAFGASLGREGAPRQISAVVGARLAARLGPDLRRVAVAAAAGAGLAAVYNVPAAGCVYAVEALLRRVTWRAALAAAVCSVLATAVSWIALPNRPVYELHGVHSSASLVLFALALGPVAGVLARAFARAVERARQPGPFGWRLPAATTAVFAALGGVSVAYPEILGNGRSASDLALTAHLAVGTAAVLLVLRPLATVACLAGGAGGSLLTPSLAVGALLGAVAGAGWAHIWAPGPLGACALVGAAAFVAVTQRASVTAVVLLVGLTGVSWTLAFPLAVAVATAHLPHFALSTRANQGFQRVPRGRSAAGVTVRSC